MQDLEGEINPHENGMFDLKEYISIMQRRKRDKDSDEDLLAIFKIIDKDENDLIGPDGRTATRVKRIRDNKNW